MNTKGSITVLSLCFLILFTLTDCSTCQTKKLEGESLSFKLVDREINDNVLFTITRNEKRFIWKRPGTQEGPGIVKNKYLELQHVNLSDAGTYKVEVFDGTTGKGLNAYTETVCVYAKVPKPRVNITCQNEKVNFRCDVEGDKDLSYSWQKNGKDIKNAVLNILKNIDADTKQYTCTAHNPVHNSTSEPETAQCSKPLTLFGFDFWIMVSILAGGGALVLLLTVVLVTLACRACKRREKQLEDEEEYRLNHLNSSPHHGSKSKQTARGQPAPPEPYDNVPAQEVPCQAEPKPRSQQRGRPPPPPIDDEEEQPPPLPQPRTKAHPKKREGPM